MKKICVIIFLTIFLVSCNNGYAENTIENITEKRTIDIAQAEFNVRTIYTELYPEAIAEAVFICESVKVIDSKIYYLVCGFNNNAERRVTFGWYFVDIYSGEVFNTGPGINELKSMKD